MTTSDPDRRFPLPPGPSAAATARGRVAAACHGLDEALERAAELATSEIVTNAVRHALPRAERSGAEISMRVTRTDQVLRVEVFDPDPRPLPAVRHPGTAQEGGWGLFLVTELAAAWGCRPDDTARGKAVWFEMSVTPRR